MLVYLSNLIIGFYEQLENSWAVSIRTFIHLKSRFIMFLYKLLSASWWKTFQTRNFLRLSHSSSIKPWNKQGLHALSFNFFCILRRLVYMGLCKWLYKALSLQKRAYLNEEDLLLIQYAQTSSPICEYFPLMVVYCQESVAQINQLRHCNCGRISNKHWIFSSLQTVCSTSFKVSRILIMKIISTGKNYGIWLQQCVVE